MNSESDVLAAEREFFTALVAGDAAALERVLADDFALIDVMTGSEISRAVLLAIVGSGQLRFEEIEPAEVRVRFYGTSAVVTGRTQMRGRFEDTPFTVRSRYTHVYAEQQGEWRLAAAQGTQIAAEPHAVL